MAEPQAKSASRVDVELKTLNSVMKGLGDLSQAERSRVLRFVLGCFLPSADLDEALGSKNVREAVEQWVQSGED